MIKRLLLLYVVMLAMVSGVMAQEEDFDLLAYEARWSPDGRWIGVGSMDGAWIFDTEDYDAEPLHYFEGEDVYVVEFDPVRPYAAMAPGTGEQVIVLEIETGEEVLSIDAPIGPDEYFSVFYDLKYSDDGQYLAIVNTTQLYVADAETGEWMFNTYDPHPAARDTVNSWLTTVRFGEETVMTSNWSSDLTVYEIENPENREMNATTLGYGLIQFELLPDSDDLLLLFGNVIYQYDFDTVEALTDTEMVNAFGFDVHDTQLAIGGEESWVLFDLEEGEVTTTFEPEFEEEAWAKRVYSLAFNPEGDQVVTLQTDGQLIVWDLESGDVVAELGEFTRGVSQKWG